MSLRVYFPDDIANILAALQMTDDSIINVLYEVGDLTPQLAKRFQVRKEARAEVAQALGVTLVDEEQ